MTFAPLLAGLGSFIIALFIHSLLWRIRRPQRDVFALFMLFGLLAPLPVLLLFSLLSTPGGSEFAAACAFVDASGALLLYCALSASYILTYPALQARCPSLRMVLHIERAGSRGLSMAEVAALFSSADLVTDRLDDLLASGLVSRKDGPGRGSGRNNEVPLRVTLRGALLLRPFMFFRRLLGLGPGTG
jgi:hypothetical protein